MNKINYSIFIIIDDLNSEYFSDLLNKGLLPNFKKLIETGLYSENCVTDFPSTTFPSQASMITGTYTGNYLKEPCHGIPLYYWMDRTVAPPYLRDYGTFGSDKYLQIYKMNDDLGNNCKTILECVNDGNTASILQFINRGTKYFFPERKLKLLLYFLILSRVRDKRAYGIRSNLVSMKKLIDLFKHPGNYFDLKEPPIASLLLFFSSDVLMHMFGYDSEIYKINLVYIDKMIGLLKNNLEELGYYDDTAIVITSDHGNYKANGIENIGNFFIERDLTRYYPRKFLMGNMNLAEFGGLGFFNFRAKGNNENIWKHPKIDELKNYGNKQVNLFDELFKLKGVKLMYYRDDNNTYRNGKIYLKAKLQNNDGYSQGYIEYQGIGKDYKTKYYMEGNGDIFNYFDDDIASKLLDNKFHSIDEWLDATYHLNYPLYPDLLPRHFKNIRSADIIVSTAGEVVYNIRHGKKQRRATNYTHDIGLRRSTIVPLIISGSKDIPIQKLKYCKATDIVPTLLKMQGLKPHNSMIGKSLI